MKVSSALYYLFIFALVADPIIVTLQYLVFTGFSPDTGLSFLQISRGFLLAILSFFILRHNFSWLKRAEAVHPLFLLAGYVLLATPFFLFPLENLVYSFRVIYLCIIMVTAMILTHRGQLTPMKLFDVASIVLLTYFSAQILAMITGAGGLPAYRTAFGSTGFNVKIAVLSWTICSLIPAFLLSGKWRKRDIIMIIIALTSIILTMRRTALVAVFILLLAVSFVRMVRKQSNPYVRAVSLLFPVAVFSTLLYVINSTDFGYVLEVRLKDLFFWEGGTASGRTVFHAIGIEHLFSRNFLLNIFGQGMGYAKVVLYDRVGVSIGMHSDWLDIAIAFGVIGVLLLVLFYKNLLKFLLQSRRMRFLGEFDTLLAIFLIALFGSLASGSTLNTSFTMVYALLGYISTRLTLNTHSLTDDEAS